MKLGWTPTGTRQYLRSAACRQLSVPRHRRSMFGRRAFSVAGAVAWNSLPNYLWDPPRSFDSFRRDLKTFLLFFDWRTQRIRGLSKVFHYALYKSIIDIDIDIDIRWYFPSMNVMSYLLTYLLVLVFNHSLTPLGPKTCPFHKSLLVPYPLTSRTTYFFVHFLGERVSK